VYMCEGEGGGGEVVRRMLNYSINLQM